MSNPPALSRLACRPLLVAAGLAVALVAALACAQPVFGQPDHHPQPAGLRVMTYNIQHGAGSDTVFNLARTAAAIRAQHPDVVALQEVDATWDTRSNYVDEPQALARALHMYAFLAPIYDTPPTSLGAADKRYGVAILSKYPILESQDHQITRLSTQVPNAVPVPAPGFAEIAIRVHGVAVHVYNTHLDYRADPSVRVTQVAETRQYIDNDPAPKILMGDLNANPQSPELAPLLADITDVWSILGQPHPASYPASTPSDAIDFVLVSKGFGVKDASIIDTLASDHRPEVADLTLPRR
ncbi:MAG: endonuclease/exonuclease/phosphatase family protein [Jatrophihabitans sp.]